MRTSIFLFIAVSMLTVSATHAETFGARLSRECPATDAWMQAHASSMENDKAMAARDAKRHLSDPALRTVLAERYTRDQKARNAWVAADYSKASTQALRAVDAGNLGWLKPLILKHGFPTVDQVGEEGILHAWMLVQHATSDPAFQARVLREIAPLLKTGEISKDDYALLEDRVRIEQGKSQIYGTQFYVPNGNDGKPMTNKDGSLDMQMRPLEDPQYVDQRRTSMGLMPLTDYKCMLRAMYAPSAQTGPGTGKTTK